MTSRLPSTLRVVYVTVPNEEVALNISRSIIGSKLAACVNIIDGVKSVYEWEGKVQEDKEQLLIIKTQKERILDLEKEITKLHPYKVPEFISLTIDHSSIPYGTWVLDQTRKS